MYMVEPTVEALRYVTLVTNGPGGAGPPAGVGSRVGLRWYIVTGLSELNLVGLFEGEDVGRARTRVNF